MAGHTDFPPHDEPRPCPDPSRACPYESERPRLMSMMDEIQRSLSSIGASMAVGSERFLKVARHEKQIEALDKQLDAMALAVEKILVIVNILRTIVFSGIGFVLLAVLGAVVALIMK